jgi:AraC-like DNA-binding protein
MKLKAIYKQFTETENFPFQFVYKDTKSPQNELPDHVHEWSEIVYVHRGEGIFFIDNAFYKMTEGDVFLLPGDTLHRAMPDKNNPVTSSILYFGSKMIPDIELGESFTLPALFDTIRKHKYYKLALHMDYQQTFNRFIDSIRHELEAQEQGYRFAIRLLLHQMLLELSRTGRMDLQEIIHPVPSGYPWLQEMLLYIDLHLEQPLSLSILAKESLVSPEHFSRVFKQMTGLRLTDYIHTKRILKAKKLLQDSVFNIETIAEACGFETLPHFHRIFKKHTGVTPASFRKQSAKG